MLSNKYFNYQPNYLNGSIVSYEALLRCVGSHQAPSHFLSSIQDKEYFDKQVITRVISDKLSLRNKSNVSISINISSVSLESESFIRFCEQKFQENSGFIFEVNFS